MTPIRASFVSIFLSSVEASVFMRSAPFFIPYDGRPETVHEGQAGRETQEAPGLGDIGGRVQDVAGPRTGINGLDRRAKGHVDGVKEAVDGHAHPAGDVGGRAGRGRRAGGPAAGRG